MTYEEIETRIERYTNYMGNLIELVRLPFGTVELERDDGGGDLALAAVYFLRVGNFQVSSGETITREEAWRRCLAAYEALHGPHEKTTKSAEDVEVERQRLARKPAEERQGEPESDQTPAPDCYPCDICGGEAGGVFGVCASCEEPLEADLSGSPDPTGATVITLDLTGGKPDVSAQVIAAHVAAASAAAAEEAPASKPEDSRGAWIMRQLAGITALARKHGIGEEAIARAVGASFEPLNAEIERLRSLAAGVKPILAAFSAVMAEGREMIAVVEAMQGIKPNVTQRGGPLDGMSIDQQEEYIFTMIREMDKARHERDDARAQLDAAAIEYDDRTAKACAMLEEEEEEAGEEEED